jgi:hypothetical protein
MLAHHDGMLATTECLAIGMKVTDRLDALACWNPVLQWRLKIAQESGEDLASMLF